MVGRSATGGPGCLHAVALSKFVFTVKPPDPAEAAKLTTNARLAWLLVATTPQARGPKSTLQVLQQRHSVVS